MICLDSDVIIDFLKGKLQALDAIKHARSHFVTTEVNRFEVMFGIHRRRIQGAEELNVATRFFDSLEVLPFGPGCADLAADVLGKLHKKGKMINGNDALIAASAMNHGCSRILTGNVKHFSRIPGLQVETY